MERLSDVKDKPAVHSPSWPYSILSLGLLHWAFGHREQALQAMEETLRMAQHVSDHVALMHALALLSNIAQQAGWHSHAQQAVTLLQR
jgi:hypothetical protein